MHKRFLFLCFAFLPLLVSAKVNPVDSLWHAWAKAETPSNKSDAAFGLAHHYLMRVQEDSTLHYVEQLEDIYNKTDNEQALWRATITRARLIHNEAKYEKALPYYHRSRAIAQQGGLEKEVAHTHLSIAITHSRLYSLDSAQYYVQLAEQGFKETGLEEEIWRCYINRAVIAKGLEDWDIADSFYLLAIKTLPPQTKSSERGYTIYSAFDYAFIHHRFELLNDVRVMWEEYKTGRQFNFSNLTEQKHLGVYQMLGGQGVDSEAILLESLKYYQTVDTNVYRQAWCYHDLAGLYYADQQYDLARKAFAKADELYSQLETPRYLVSIRRRLSELYAMSGDYKKALEYTEASYRIVDSVRTEITERTRREFMVKYETEQKEQALKISNLELGQKTRERNILLGSSILLAFLAAVIVLGLRRQIRQREQLAQQEVALQAQRIQQLEQEKRLTALSSMLSGQEQERQRIAKDLHDGMGGLLTTVKAHYNTLVSEVGNDTEKALAVAPLTGQLIDRACTEVRRISQNLMPAALFYSGLRGALEDLAAQVRTSGVECTLELVGKIDAIDKTKAIALYRVLQEAINNSLKHAEAQHLLLQVIMHQDTVQVTVEDDGKGFQVAEGQLERSHGLKSMDSRIQFLEGVLDIDSELEVGTTISLQFPLQ